MISTNQPTGAALTGDEKAAYVNKMFGRIAGRYDLMNALMTFGQDRLWRRFTVRAARPSRHGYALDVATGTGELALELARHADRVVGVDFCGEMIVPAQAKVARSGLSQRVRLMVGDALALPFEDDSFDCATTGFAMRNVTDMGQAFSEMRRVIKPGGRVACLEVARPDSALIRGVHRFYFFRVVPLLGRLVSGEREAYVYLPDSSTRFPSPPRLAEIMENAGLRNVHFRKLGFGAVAVHWGTK